MPRTLKKNLKKELNAIPVPTVPLSEATYAACRRNKSGPRRKIVIKPVVVVVLAVAILFGTVFSISAGLRNMVISIFRSPEAEVIPEDIFSPSGHAPSGISFAGRQKIEEIADIQYFRMEGPFTLQNNVATVRTDEGLEYYKISDTIEKLDFASTHISDEIVYNAISYPLSFDYGYLDGRLHIENQADSMEQSYSTNVLRQYGEEQVWMELIDPQSASYYVLYNLKTGVVTDILRGYLDEDAVLSYFEISPSGNYFLLGLDKFYVVHTQEQRMVSLSEEPLVSCTFINEEWISVLRQQDGEGYHAYTYNVKSGAQFTLFENGQLLDALGKVAVGYISLGSGYYMHRSPEGYTLIEPNGEVSRISGLQATGNMEFLLSPDKTKIAVANLDAASQSSLQITELGVIDLQKKELRIFNREDYSKGCETSMFWNDASSLAVTAENGSHSLYLYRFTEDGK